MERSSASQDVLVPPLAAPPVPVPELKILKQEGMQLPRFYRSRLLRGASRCLPPTGGAKGPPTVKYLFASPLVRVTDRGEVQSMPRLDVAGEVRSLWEVAAASKHPMSLETEVATVETLRTTLLSSQNLVLHLSTHGFPGGLILEDCVGKAHTLALRQLRDLLQAHVNPLRVKLVFLNSCHSFELGHLFLKVGISAVICTREGASVKDDDAKYFTKTFYAALGNGRTVHEAFGIAQTAGLARPSGGQDPYLLLTHGSAMAPIFGKYVSDDEHSASEGCEGGPSSGSDRDDTLELSSSMQAKAASIMKKFKGPRSTSNASAGSGTNRPLRRWRPALPSLPAPADDFISRDSDVWAVVGLLYRRRLVVVCGAKGTKHGIGKTGVAEEVARWATARAAFPGGVHFVRLAGNSSLAAQADPWASVYGVLSRRPRAKSPLDAVMDELKRAKGQSLLVLDEADHIVQQEAFQRALQSVLSQVSKLHVLVTTHQSVFWPDGKYKAVHFQLRPLSKHACARLFMRRIGRPLHSLDFAEDARHVIAATPDPAAYLEALVQHPIQGLWQGHPRQVLAAAARVNADLRSLNDLVGMGGEESHVAEAVDFDWRAESAEGQPMRAAG